MSNLSTSKVLILSIIASCILTIQGCNSKYNPDTYLTSSAEKDSLIQYFLPYILPRPNDFPIEDRFKDSMKVYYASQIKPQELELTNYFITKDSVHYCMFVRKDLKSLYIDYRATAATFNKKNDSIYNVELKFMTPMFRRDTIYRIANPLFEHLVEKGNIDQYIGNRDFIDWPSNDVFYDKATRKWTLKSSSEWNKITTEEKK